MERTLVTDNAPDVMFSIGANTPVVFGIGKDSVTANPPRRFRICRLREKAARPARKFVLSCSIAGLLVICRMGDHLVKRGARSSMNWVLDSGKMMIPGLRFALLKPLAVGAIPVVFTIFTHALAVMATLSFVRREKRLGREGEELLERFCNGYADDDVHHGRAPH